MYTILFSDLVNIKFSIKIDDFFQSFIHMISILYKHSLLDSTYSAMPYLVAYEIKKSEISNIGIFTKVAIKKGDKVSKLEPNERIYYTIDQVKIIENSYDNEARIKDLLTYGWYDEKIDKYIYALDDDRCINHSDNPNLEETMIDDELYQVALRDIEVGEELTNDYGTFECLSEYILTLYRKYNVWVFAQ
jgi:SET domain-containing protein